METEIQSQNLAKVIIESEIDNLKEGQMVMLRINGEEPRLALYDGKIFGSLSRNRIRFSAVGSPKTVLIYSPARDNVNVSIDGIIDIKLFTGETGIIGREVKASYVARLFKAEGL